MKLACSAIVTLLLLVLNHAFAEQRLPSQDEFVPKNGQGRVVVLISGQTGPSNYSNIARNIASQGYYAVLLNGNDFWLDRASKDDYQQKSDLLQGVIVRAQQSPRALPGKVAVIGFSRGGAPSLSFATRMTELVYAVVAYYPLTAWIRDPDSFVSKIAVPTLMMAGVNDTYLNCCAIATARKLAAVAKTSPDKPSFEVVEYPDTGHGWEIPGPLYRGGVAADSFQRTLRHLSQYLDK